MRKEYEMTDEQLERIMEASQPVAYIVAIGRPPRSPQENANAAWERLGKEMGFKHLTVKPVSGKATKFFTAESAEEVEE